MTLKHIPLLLALALFAVSLIACELPASTPPPPSPTGSGAMETLQSELGSIATQTAAAGGKVGVPTSTKTAGTPEATVPTIPTATPQPTTITVPSPTPGIPASYTLQKGEFPFCIARRFNVNQDELLSINGLSLASNVPVGFTLQIPQSGHPFNGQRALHPHPTTYAVAAGDTIHTIACYFGDVSPDAIIQANGLTSPYALTPGQTLNIP